jgi:ribosomal-protein-alanine N-acetyltransferase
MKRVEFAPFPTLTTDRLVLREVVADDADDLLIFRGDAEAQRYNLAPMRSRAEALALVRTMQAWYESQYAVQWGITLRGDDRVVGLCGLHEWNARLGRAALGYDLARSHWGQGIAIEAVRAVLRFGFEQWGLTRVDAYTIVENVRSVRLLDRLGFKLEEVRREYAPHVGGRFQGRAQYVLPRADFAPDATPRDDGQG